MKIIVVGGTGTLGKVVVSKLEKNHDVIAVGRNTKISVDITDHNSIRAMYEKIGKFDALVSTTGKVSFKPLQELSHEDFNLGLQNKLMGQVQLVTEGLKYIKLGGSFTLTTGILNEEPILGGVSAAMVNGAIEGFVKAASLEMIKNNARINVVSPSVITEALGVYADFFKGFESVGASTIANAFVKSIEGIETGKVYKVGF